MKTESKQCLEIHAQKVKLPVPWKRKKTLSAGFVPVRGISQSTYESTVLTSRTFSLFLDCLTVSWRFIKIVSRQLQASYFGLAHMQDFTIFSK